MASTSLPAENFYVYEDDAIVMHVPIYLRPKKGIRYFASYRKGDRLKPITNIAVDLPTKEGATAEERNLMTIPDMEWEGVKFSTVRRGSPAYLGNGVESLSTSRNALTSDVFHAYHVVYTLDNRYVSVGVTGRSDIADFDAYCRHIVLTLRLKS